MQLTPNFILQEFIDPATHAKFGDASLWFIDPRLVRVVQAIRMLTGRSIAINNWHTGGAFKESGFRPASTETGASMSQHKFGRAADLKFKDLGPTEALKIVQANYAQLRTLGLTCVEDPAFTPTWLHIDVRNTANSENLLIIKP